MPCNTTRGLCISKLINNVLPNGMVEDIRIPVINNTIPLVYKKTVNYLIVSQMTIAIQKYTKPHRFFRKRNSEHSSLLRKASDRLL